MPLVGLLDTGVGAELAAFVAAARGFALDATGAIVAAADAEDLVGHGTIVARTIVSAAPRARLLVARIFDGSLATAPALVAAGLDWLVERGAVLVNLSLGLRADRDVLRRACADAIAAGVVLVAASPARGPAVYPAAYPGVIRVSGDARCAVGEISDLGGDPADFGACPRAGETVVAGASAAAAHASGIVAAWLAARLRPASADEVCAHLAAIARHHGRERRR